MKWIWIGWAGCAATLVLLALAMEVSAIRGRINGANGLAWLVAMIISALGSLVVALISWIFAGTLAALAVLGVAAAALTATWFGSGMIFEWEISKVQKQHPDSQA